MKIEGRISKVDHDSLILEASHELLNNLGLHQQAMKMKNTLTNMKNNFKVQAYACDLNQSQKETPVPPQLKSMKSASTRAPNCKFKKL